MSRTGKSETEIADRVRAILSKVRQERSSQPVFTPQFLSRLKRTIVFRPLDEAAMVGIARKLIGRMCELWRQKRDKAVEVADELLEFIGRRAQALNERSSGQEGGRIVRKLISDVLETALQREATRRATEYHDCRRILLRPAGVLPDAIDATAPELCVLFAP